MIYHIYISYPRSNKKKRSQDIQEEDSKIETDREQMEAEVKPLQDQQKLLDEEQKMKENKNKKCCDAKTESSMNETTFLDPTVDQIKELQDGPKNMDIKKTD